MYDRQYASEVAILCTIPQESISLNSVGRVVSLEHIQQFGNMIDATAA